MNYVIMNWKTSILGLPFLAYQTAVQVHLIDPSQAGAWIAAFSLAAVGLAAKDSTTMPTQTQVDKATVDSKA